MKTFTLRLQPATFTLGLAEIWPDGDAPEHPTPHDVVAQMEKTRMSVDEWNLRPDRIEVQSVDGECAVYRC
jgi:hypothetical protein